MSIIFLFFLLLITIIFCFLKKTKTCQYLLLFIFIYLISISTGFIPKLLAYPLQKPFITEPTITWKQNNVIILLGGGDVLLPDTNTVIPSTMVYARLNKAAALYFDCKKYHTCKILIAGGIDKTTHTAESINYRDNLIELGIPSTDFILEDKSKNTRQNALYSKKILQHYSFDQMILVTSSIHLQRAHMWFEYYDIPAIPIAADYQTSQNNIASLGYNFALTDATLHEYLGIIQIYTGLYAKNQRNRLYRLRT